MTIDGKVHKLLKAMYGLRDAGAAFDLKVLDVNQRRMPLGKLCICVGDWKAMHTHLTCRDECLFEANTACLVQLARAEGGERWELEANPRHVEILVSQMRLSNESKAVSTPGVRTTDEEDGKELDAEGRACHRSWTVGQLSQSRQVCELQFAVQELARRMQQPNTKNMQALKRLVRFLKGSRRCLVGRS